MGTKTDRRARAEHLFRVVSSDRFLQKQGLGNEVPFFICAFDAEDGLSLGEDREDLIARLSHAGGVAGSYIGSAELREYSVFSTTNTPNIRAGESVTAATKMPKISARCTTAIRPKLRLAVCSSTPNDQRRRYGTSTRKSITTMTRICRQPMPALRQSRPTSSAFPFWLRISRITAMKTPCAAQKAPLMKRNPLMKEPGLPCGPFDCGAS